MAEPGTTFTHVTPALPQEKVAFGYSPVPAMPPEPDHTAAPTPPPMDFITRVPTMPPDRAAIDRLLAGKRALSVIRWRVGGLTVTIACITALSFEVSSNLNVLFEEDYSCCSAREFILMMLRELLWDSRFFVLSLAPLADSTCLTRIVLLTDAAAFATSRIVALFSPSKGYVGFEWYLNLMFYIRGAAFCLGALVAMTRSSAKAMRTWMWGCVGMFLVMNMIESITAGIYMAITEQCISVMLAQAVSNTLVLIVVCQPKWRKYLQTRFGHVAQAYGARAAAAGIAGLVGECSVNEALSDAKRRFRCVPFSSIRREDFDRVCAQPVSERAKPARLGCCDAFLSHSWHDSPEAKWEALQEWRESFVARHEREPAIWLDRLCIDQGNIESDLRSLPLFLSGCKEMLVLCGPTYLSRLWCVVELFTFVHMGGDIGRITVVQLRRKGLEARDTWAIQRSVDDFDAGLCSCSISGDKEKMVGAIEAAFGDTDGFNATVRELLSKLLAEDSDAGSEEWSESDRSDD